MTKIHLSSTTWPAWILLGICLLLSVIASLQVKRSTEQDAVMRFASSCDQVMLKVQERLGAYALILRGGAGLFAASDAVSRQEWRGYVEKLRPQMSIPGVQGIGFAQVVAPEKLAAHIAGIRGEGFPGYTVRPPGDRALYTSIIYLEPFRDRNLRAFGFDMFSEPVRRAAMEQARDTGEAALSGRVELVQETGKNVQAGTLMYVPVYHNGAETGTLEQRRAALAGWVYSPYRMNDLMEGILADWTRGEGATADLHIYDGAQATPASMLFDNKPDETPSLSSPFNQARTIEFNGTRWLLVFDRAEAGPGFIHAPALATLLGGLALSGLLFGLMLSVINTRSNAVLIAGELTRYVVEKSEQLNAIFALSPDGFVSFDDRHRVTYVSPAFLVLTGINESEVHGLDEHEFSLRLTRECLATARFPGIAALRNEQKAGAGDTAGEPSAARRHLIETGGVAGRVLDVTLRESNTEAVSQILYLRDITHETEVARLKSEFLSTAAHELRTPMASIYGFSELLIAHEFDEAERRDLLATIYKQSGLMASIINELLDLARIEARRGKDFVIETVDVHELLQGVVSGFKAPDGRPSPRQAPAGGPLAVSADRGKLIQAVSNVLANAYKYSPDGGAVEIDVITSVSENDKLPMAGIRIIDHGIGMTPQQLARVGERFYRADASGSIPGTGLGMAIVKELVELHGGRLELDSKVGAGTTVTIWLPAADLTPDPNPDPNPSGRLHPATTHPEQPS